MATNAQLVAVRVAEVGAVIIRMVVRAQSGRPFAGAAMRQRDRVGLVDGGAGGRQQRRHLAVAGLRRMAVEWLGNNEQGPGCIGADPAGPALAAVAEFELQAERSHQRRVESKRALEAGNADNDMREHGAQVSGGRGAPFG